MDAKGTRDRSRRPPPRARPRWLALLVLASLASCRTATGPSEPKGQSGPVAVSVTVSTTASGYNVPADFLGLAFELPVLADPLLRDPALEPLLRNLGPGTFRFGGNSLETTVWTPTPTDDHGSGFELTPRDLEAVFDVARRIGWRVTLALPIRSSALSSAGDEAAALAALGGDALLAAEPGNETNLYNLNGLRSPAYTVDSAVAEFDTAAAAVRARVPDIPIAGPAAWCTGGEGWFREFLDRTATPLAFATAHYYPMGRTAADGSDEHATLDNMLSPALMARSRGCVGAAAEAARAHGLTLRVDATNSAYGFGQPEVSDVFASALWALDYLHTLAEVGVAGVNVQTGTDENGGLTCDGVYLPVCRDDRRWVARPLYYGMLLFHQAARGRAVALSATSVPAANVVAHAVLGDDDSTRVVLINKEPRATATVTLALTPGPSSDEATVLRLSSPSLLARDSITLGEAAVADDGTWAAALVPRVDGAGGNWAIVLPPASAALVTVGGAAVAASGRR